jgi:hypothetical protein
MGADHVRQILRKAIPIEEAKLAVFLPRKRSSKTKLRIFKVDDERKSHRIDDRTTLLQHVGRDANSQQARWLHRRPNSATPQLRPPWHSEPRCSRTCSPQWTLRAIGYRRDLDDLLRTSCIRTLGTTHGPVCGYAGFTQLCQTLDRRPKSNQLNEFVSILTGEVIIQDGMKLDSGDGIMALTT